MQCLQLCGACANSAGQRTCVRTLGQHDAQVLATHTPEHVLSSPLRSTWRRHAVRQQYLSNPGVVGRLLGAYRQLLVTLQVKKALKGKAGKHDVPAANLTKDEFAVALGEISKIMHTEYNMKFNRTGKVAFDNPRNHDLSKLQYTGCNLGRSNVIRPPRYSGDFMQCIEHVHAIVCAEFQRQRFRQGRVPFDVDVDGAHLKEVFFPR